MKTEIKPEQFLSITPKSNLISKHIAYYYFHKSTDKNFKKDILYHPHICTALNIYKNVKLDWDDTSRTYISTTSKKPTIAFTTCKTTSKEVKLRGNFDKIGIIFNPLGISFFIDVPLSSLVNDRISIFDYFGQPFLDVSTLIYQESSLEKKRDLLDAFFESNFVGFNEIRLINAVSIIIDKKGICQMQEIAASLGISRETLFRLFKKHMCCSVELFKSILKFRRALDYYQTQQIKSSLTQIALETEYYDQSNFIHHFKAVTGYNPKKFFSSIQDVSKAGTYWSIKTES